MIVLLSYTKLSYLSIILLLLFPSLVATFEACPTSKVPSTPRQFWKPSRQVLDVIISLDYNWALSAHLNTSPEEEEDVWILNPESNRRIKKDGPKWHEFMNHRGGYICHDSNLVPIQLDRLWAWTQKESRSRKSLIVGDPVVDCFQSQQTPNTAWKRLYPEILSLEEVPNGINDDSLPFLDELLFAYKPPSLLTLPGIGEDKQICLSSLVNDWIPENLGHSKQRKPSNDRKKKRKKKPLKPFVPRPCHRLDYDTSGTMIVGLTRDALRLTNAMFEQKGAEQSASSSNGLKKRYVALVAGSIANDDGMIAYAIGKVFNKKKNYNEFVCLHNDSKWKEEDFVEKSLRDAKTVYTVLKRFTLPISCSTSTNNGSSQEKLIQYTKVQLEPLTGRGHQLRLHMAAIGHPILGDQLHAPETIAHTTPRLCLHAEELELCVRIDGDSDDGTCTGHIRVRSIPPF